MQRFVNSGIRPHEGADGHAPVDVIRIEAQAAPGRGGVQDRGLGAVELASASTRR